MPPEEPDDAPIEQVHLDLEEISRWIGGIQGVLSKVDPTISVSAGRWEPPPAAGVVPIALPRCIRPLQGQGTAPTSIADLVNALGCLKAWTEALAKML